MSEPAWLIEARKYIGVREIKGVTHNSLIVGWWKAIKRGGIKDDETPYCAAYCGAMLEAVGLRSTRFESAASYLDWGQPLTKPVVGAIAVFTRPGGNHVGFVVGRTKAGDLLILGGNQSDAVNIRAFSVKGLRGLRWPLAVPVPTAPLPLLAGVERSTSEA